MDTDKFSEKFRKIPGKNVCDRVLLQSNSKIGTYRSMTLPNRIISWVFPRKVCNIFKESWG